MRPQRSGERVAQIIGGLMIGMGLLLIST